MNVLCKNEKCFSDESKSKNFNFVAIRNFCEKMHFLHNFKSAYWEDVLSYLQKFLMATKLKFLESSHQGVVDCTFILLLSTHPRSYNYQSSRLVISSSGGNNF